MALTNCVCSLGYDNSGLPNLSLPELTALQILENFSYAAEKVKGIVKQFRIIHDFEIFAVDFFFIQL